MGIQINKYPILENPFLYACWPGLGNIGSVAGDSLIKKIEAEEFAEIESWDFFYPKKVRFKSGVLENLEFPTNKFFFKKLPKRDVVIFMGEEEPDSDSGSYAQGNDAFEMGNLILDVAEKFGCKRIYTSCAAISGMHHRVDSKVWAVTSHAHLKAEVLRYIHTTLVSRVEGNGRFSRIPGLKGVLPGLAKSRGLEAVVLQGEIPDYLTRVNLPYPKASRAVFQVLCELLDIRADYAPMDEMVDQIEKVIDKLLEEFPADLKERVEQRKTLLQHKPETISQEDGTWIKQHIDELFKKGGGPNG